jgi:replicative DNA helicase
MLINPACRSLVKKILIPGDFYRGSHQHIFTCMIEQDDDPDLVTVKDSLVRKGLLEKVGGEQYLMSLVDVVSTSAGVEHHAKTVKEHSIKRKLVLMATDLIDQSERLSSEELASNVKQRLNAIDIRDRFGFKSGVDISNVYTPAKCLKEYDEYIRTLRGNRFITGIHEIDRRIRGVAGGEVLFIIARAGSFKTAMLQNLLKNYIQHSSWGAIFFSIEMPIASVTERYHQITQGSTGRDIEEIYVTTKNGTSQIKAALETKFIEDLKNLFIIPTKVSISDVARYVKLVE